MKIKNGDQILVVKGKDKGRKSKVLRSFPKELMVSAEGINMKKKHQRSKKEGQSGQIVEVSRPIPISKIKLICPKCGKPTRIGYKIINGKKIRICKRCGSEI